MPVDEHGVLFNATMNISWNAGTPNDCDVFIGWDVWVRESNVTALQLDHGSLNLL